jgi:hypothetical protein
LIRLSFRERDCNDARVHPAERDKGSRMSDEGVELSDVIREVRGDLEKAIWAA